MERFMYNLTGINLDVYFAANTSGQTFVFLITILSTLILNPLCIVALFSAKEINWKMRALIINIFTAEICNSFGYSLLLLGFPTRFNDQINDDVSCKLAVSSIITAVTAKFSANAFYAVMVYIFIKHGIKKIKWSVVLLAVAVTWIAGLAVGIPANFFNFTYNNAGFCESDSKSSVYIYVIILSVVGMTVAVCTTVTFGILTFCYIRRNTLSSNSEVKKSIARHLFYLTTAAIVAFVSNLLPASFPAIRAALAGQVIVNILVVHYVFRLLFNSLNIITPVATIILLKPMRPALKQLFVKIYCCKSRRDTPNAEDLTNERQLNERGPTNNVELQTDGRQPTNRNELTNETDGAQLRESTNENQLTNERRPTDGAQLTDGREPTNENEPTTERVPTDGAQLTEGEEPTNEDEPTRVPTEGAQLIDGREPTNEDEPTNERVPTEGAQLTDGKEPTNEDEPTNERVPTDGELTNEDEPTSEEGQVIAD
jgi:hypothetical protein